MIKSFRRSFVALMWWVDLILIIVASVILPCRLIYIGVERAEFRTLPDYTIWLLITGALTIIVHLIYIASERLEYFTSVLDKFLFLFQSRSAWSMGSSLACFVVGLYFYFPSDGNLANRFQGSLGIYAGVLGTTLAVDIFYENLAPITDVNKLLAKIVSDLESSRRRANSRLWFVYPALNIGYYRTLLYLGKENEDERIPSDHIYSRFRTKLKETVFELGGQGTAKAITFPVSLYKPFYERYEETHGTKGSPSTKRIERCSEDAQILFKAEGFKTKEINPEIFPQHVIIIGDIVYTIMSYGLPVYDPSSGKFQGGEKELASLLVYRKKDASLAKKISEHLDKLISPATP
jgi:hypothetical protein